MFHELALFGKIQKEYQEQQNEYLGKELNDPEREGPFKWFVTAYFAGWLVLSIANCIIAGLVWVPRLLDQPSAVSGYLS